MLREIRRVFPRPDLLRQDESARVKEALARTLDGFSGSPRERGELQLAIGAAYGVVDRDTASRNEERFFMLYPSQNRFVVEQLTLHSERPKVATRLWAYVLEFVGRDYEVLVTREGLIERVGASGRAVDGVLSELVKMGALERLREPEPGKQGRGTVRYFLNPRVGFKDRTAGETAGDRREAPLLKIIDGSAHPSQRRAYAPRFDPVVV